jgi:hypothetical protein
MSFKLRSVIRNIGARALGLLSHGFVMGETNDIARGRKRKKRHATDVILSQIPQNFLGLRACVLKSKRQAKSFS